ncbi:MAG: alpha/beta fold hydrolase [Ignavibacteria bacterium]|nr:alpha/beta fold hydrolase [Ignavibacteria bacterium]
MNTIKVEGISVNDYGGEGNALIFIHAFPLCSRMWDSQVEHFSKMYRVVTYDVRGLGYSTDIPDYQFTMEELVNDLIMIMDHLGIDKAHACGLSMGGYILQRAMLKNPGRFLSATLADTKSEGENNESLLSRSNDIIKIKSEGTDGFFDGMVKKLISERSYENEEPRTFIRTMMSWMKPEGVIGTMMAIATRTNSFYLLKDIEIPCHVIVGRNDVLTPPVKSFFMKENLKEVEFTVIEECGHLSNMEKHEEFNSAVERFLKHVEENLTK